MLCYKKLKKSLFIFLIIIFSLYSFAHLDVGKDKVIDGYLIDFGYTPENPKVTDKVTMAFNLLNDTTKEIIEPTSVWIRISSSKEVVFAGTFHTEAQNVVFNYVFPYADDYEITARFKDNDNTLVETDFEIKIEKKSKIKLYYIAKIIIILIIAGFIIKKFKVKHKKRRSR